MRLIGAIVLFTLLSGCAVSAPSGSPGYADFKKPEQRGLRRDTSISLGPTILRLVAVHANEGPETAALLRALDGVQVKVYEIGESADLKAVSQELELARVQLLGDDWQQIARVLDEGSTVNLLLKTQGDSIVGMTALVLKPDQLVFVNLMGDLSAEQLAEISMRMPNAADLDLSELPLPGLALN
ncbi:MAG: hypothetical protein ACI87W_000208 [Halieaceae bacterium]|jgi:hypothetical protein